jgi:CDGSH-type Zn-finger protein
MAIEEIPIQGSERAGLFTNTHFLSLSDKIQVNLLRKENVMGACTCGYTRDEEKNCDGTHKVVKAVKAELAEKLEANGFPHASEYVKNN